MMYLKNRIGHFENLLNDRIAFASEPYPTDRVMQGLISDTEFRMSELAMDIITESETDIDKLVKNSEISEKVVDWLQFLLYPKFYRDFLMWATQNKIENEITIIKGAEEE